MHEQLHMKFWSIQHRRSARGSCRDENAQLKYLTLSENSSRVHVSSQWVGLSVCHSDCLSVILTVCLVYISGCLSVTSLFSLENGAVDAEIVTQAVQQIFLTYDSNNDGQLSMNELYTILDVEDSIFGDVSISRKFSGKFTPHCHATS